MDSREIDCPRRGGIYRFIQIYESGTPKIVCFKGDSKKSLETDCVNYFIKYFNEVLINKSSGSNFSLAGGGEIAIGINRTHNSLNYSIWNKSPKEDFRIDQEHVKNYYEIKKRKLELK